MESGSGSTNVLPLFAAWLTSYIDLMDSSLQNVEVVNGRLRNLFPLLELFELSSCQRLRNCHIALFVEFDHWIMQAEDATYKQGT